jgi:transcriptional regulator of arginine metabolism
MLGIGRTAAPGGRRYQVPADAGALPIEPVRGLVDAVLHNGSLVVVRTKAGAASAIARAIDDARLVDTLGTLAGDDTIFVAPMRDRGAPVLAKRLRRLFGV